MSTRHRIVHLALAHADDAPRPLLPRRQRHEAAQLAPGSAEVTGGERGAPAWASRPLWDPASGRFDPIRLRAAILARGWTVAEFACIYGGGRSTFYRVMQGIAPGDRTWIRVNETLATREPTVLIDG